MGRWRSRMPKSRLERGALKVKNKHKVLRFSQDDNVKKYGAFRRHICW
jgi:hypothetical protein